MNPWERVVKNCNLNAAISPGGHDLSRMKFAMINRKADFSKKESMGGDGTAGGQAASFNF